MDAVVRELRFALRALARDKGFSLTTVFTLAISVAASAAMFAIVNGILLRPLPFADSDAILLMGNQYPKAGVGRTSYSAAGDYYDRLRDVSALGEQAMFNFSNQTIDINGSPEQVRGMAATPPLFRVLGVSAAIGRTFTDEEGETGNDRKVILSHALWQQLFAGDAKALGRELRMDGRPREIVGVMAKGFEFYNAEPRYWTPLSFTAEQKATHHSNNWLNIGRLKPGATMARVQSQVDAINATNLDRFPEMRELIVNAGFHTVVKRLRDDLTGDIKSALYLLWGGALCLVLIGGVNLVSVTLARLSARRREMATRIALGASRGRIAAQSLAEHTILALAGGLAGLALAYGALWLAATFAIEKLPRAGEVGIDATAVAFALILSLLIGVITGLAPLAGSFRRELGESLREDSRGGAGGRASSIARQSLVAFQVACAFVLTAGAGLLLASFSSLLKSDPGFQAAGVLTAAVSAPGSRYAGGVELRSLMDRGLQSLRALPGVTDVGATTIIPLGGNSSDSVIFAEGYTMKPGESVVSPRQSVVTPGYMEAMRIKLASGRYFDEGDTESSKRVILVDERLAKKFWLNQDPIGRRAFQPQDPKNLAATDEKTRWLTVVGVVKQVRMDDLGGDQNTAGAYYFPAKQSPPRAFVFAIRTQGSATALTNSARMALAAIDPQLALFDIRTMEERAERSLASRKTSMFLAMAYGGIALLLAAVGIYGVLAYLVTQRRREIGIRVALGSTQGGIAKLVLREGALLAGAGLLLGLAGAAALRPAIESQVYGVQPLDPGVLGAAVLLLGSIALLACAVPARRAMKVDPAMVLNQQ